MEASRTFIRLLNARFQPATWTATYFEPFSAVSKARMASSAWTHTSSRELLEDAGLVDACVQVSMEVRRNCMGFISQVYHQQSDMRADYPYLGRCVINGSLDATVA